MVPMNRMFLRVFLTLGGLAFLGAGILEGSLFFIALGVLAAAVGGFGIWYDMRQVAE